MAGRRERARGNAWTVLLALVLGLVIQAGMVGLMLVSRSDLPVWNVVAIVNLAGPPPVIGSSETGEPMLEGTPVHYLFAIFGLIIGVVLYSALAYYALGVLKRRRSSA
ncbi:MAG TPA: hypothetical protein VL332_08890 [Candidatus Saccharimonadaceae bacterium]|jgi:hypothetical protein|nr:hypothetical protein [Candidatus Saccharimonadaceae bacterium]